MPAQELGAIKYSGRTGRGKGQQQAAGSHVKVKLAATPLVQSAFILAAFVWWFDGVTAAAISAIAYLGITSVFQLIVLKRQEERLKKAQVTGSTIARLRMARWLAFAFVVSLNAILGLW